MSRVFIGIGAILSLVVSMVAHAVPAQSAPATAGDRLEWAIRPVTPPGITGNTIPMMEFSSLQIVPLGRYLVVRNGTLIVEESEVKDFRFEPSGSGVTTLRYMFVVAIRSRSGRYLKAAPDGDPAPVVLSPTPAFEWVIRGGQSTSIVPIGAAVSVRNLVKRDQLVSCPNAQGGLQIGWSAQCGAWAAGEQPVAPAPFRPLLPTGPLIPPRIDPRQWSIEGLPPINTGIGIGHLFALRNTEAGKYLRFSGQTPSWQDALARSFTWTKLGGGTTLLRYMAGPVAITSQGRYVRSTIRGSRLPVTLSEIPAFEWRITGGTPGQIVHISQPMALRNVIRSDELVVCPQAGLGWQAECGARRGPFVPSTQLPSRP